MCFSFPALPFIEDRKREIAKLKEVFESYGEQIPIVINLDETVSDADEESMTASARLTAVFASLFVMHVNINCTVSYSVAF
jgi:hypothetical protein